MNGWSSVKAETERMFPTHPSVDPDEWMNLKIRAKADGPPRGRAVGFHNFFKREALFALGAAAGADFMPEFFAAWRRKRPCRPADLDPPTRPPEAERPRRGPDLPHFRS